uniref:ribosomal protein S3 n=1 Tax=Tsunamia transpacifica TaxID=1935457 RepID=UPI001BEF6FAA|nr:ribosomal protein S3 [Tsunamia transpacifica]QUE27856.1 ribosomal protein S3 [Tsunamia transpacifica]UNJ14372.1 ribosomal protein S3 [Tsunamia transpacifica]
MGQKIHPLGFRLGVTQTHRSLWFAKPKNYSVLLQEDYQMRSYITAQFSEAQISRIQISRRFDQIEVEIYSGSPSIILGRMGSGLEDLRQRLQNLLNPEVKIRVKVYEVEPGLEASLIAKDIASHLETKQVNFRRIVKSAIQRAQKANIKGIKVQISGRLNGAEIARSEWVREGRVPLQTLRADIDYTHQVAYTTYGILGIKVWLFKGEILNKENLFL